MNKTSIIQNIQTFLDRVMFNKIAVSVLSLFFSFFFLFFFILIENRTSVFNFLLNLKGNYYVLHIILLNFSVLSFISSFWNIQIRNKFIISYSNNLLYMSLLAVIASPLIEVRDNYFSGECLAITENILYMTGFFSFFTSIFFKAVVLIWTFFLEFKIYMKKKFLNQTAILLNVTSAFIFILVFVSFIISFFHFYFIDEKQIRTLSISILYKNFLYIPEKILVFFYQHVLLGSLILFSSKFLKSSIHYAKIFNILIIVNPIFNIFNFYSYFQYNFFDLDSQIDYFLYIRSFFWIIPICFYLVLLIEFTFYNRNFLFIVLIITTSCNLILRELNFLAYNAVLDPFKFDIFLALFFIGYLVVHNSLNIKIFNFELQIYCFILGMILNFASSSIMITYEHELLKMRFWPFALTSVFNMGIFFIFLGNMYFVLNLFMKKSNFNKITI